MTHMLSLLPPSTFKTAVLAAAALLVAAGCSIPYAANSLEDGNRCETDDDCPGNSACTYVSDANVCVSTSVDLPNLVLEVRPALGSRSGSAPILLSAGSLTSSGPAQVLNLGLDLPASVDVSPGTVLLPCAGDVPVPAKVSFRPVPSVDLQEIPGLGSILEDVEYQASSMLDDNGSEAFAVSVPTGLYDLYLQPQPDLLVHPDCVSSPPIFLPRQVISKASGLAVHANAPFALTGTLKLSEKEDFTQWFLEVVEPFGGRTISEIVQPEQAGIALEVPFEVHFDWTARGDFTPIIRLRPPEKSGKPVIHWRLDAVALQGTVGNVVPVKLDVSSIDTLPRKVGGQVFHDGVPTAATVMIRSTAISGDELTHYVTVVETNEAGQFESAVPPGDYQIIASPYDKSLAIGLTTWKIAKGAECFCGNSVSVPSATTLAGEVATPTGGPANVEVRLTPSALGVVSYLGTILAQDIQPRQAGAFASTGDFQVSVDPGMFDLSIVTTPGSAYPWLVRPRLLVAATDAGLAPVVSLAPFQLQSPAVLQGFLEDASGAAIPGATIRAWIPVGDDAEPTTVPGAAQIAETVVNGDGSYVLLLPPSIRDGK